MVRIHSEKSLGNLELALVYLSLASTDALRKFTEELAGNRLIYK